VSTIGTQVSFADMGTPLERATFVVVDLETTGGAPGARSLTEIGAVKVRAGQVLAEFSTLVNPGVAVPAQITMLTGITNAMVAGAPGVRTCVEAFLDWADLLADDVVLVAHNARFDVGHLRGAAAALVSIKPGQGYDFAYPTKVLSALADVDGDGVLLGDDPPQLLGGPGVGLLGVHPGAQDAAHPQGMALRADTLGLGRPRRERRTQVGGEVQRGAAGDDVRLLGPGVAGAAAGRGRERRPSSWASVRGMSWPACSRTVPTSTVSSSGTRISSRTPDAGEGTSVSTLSVATSSRGSSASTVSPTALSQEETVPSVTDSPRAGIFTDSDIAVFLTLV